MPSRARTPAGRLAKPPPLADDCALFLDIDGTLAELVDDPARARIDDDLVALLPVLTVRLGGALALVTGRSIGDVDRLLPIPRLAIAGQHGGEWRSADGSIHSLPASAGSLARMREAMAALATKHPALRLEDKGVALALHYRQAPALASYVHRALRRSLAALCDDGYVMEHGKMLLEVRPGTRDKGTAIRDFMAEAPFAGRRPVFVGDDRSDEHGFAVVDAQDGWSIKVGRGRTQARYRLRDVAAVRRWLVAAPSTSERRVAHVQSPASATSR